MGEKGIFLEYRVDFSFIGGQLGNFLPVKQHLALICLQKAAQNTQKRCFPAAGASHQHCRAIDRPCKILQNRRIAKVFAEVPYLNAHACTSPQRRIFAVRSSRATAADSAADSSTITSVHANTSGVDSVILAR